MDYLYERKFIVMSELGKRLREIRQERRLTLKEVATKVGVSLSTYREWEYGRSILGEPYIKIASALGVTLGELLGEKKPTKHRVMSEIEKLESHLNALKKELGSYF